MVSSTDAALSRSSKNKRNQSVPSVNRDDIPLIACLPKTVRTRVLNSLKPQGFDAGSPIISRGDPGNEVFILQSGTAQVLNYSETGRVVAYATLEPGAVFGELAAIDGKPRSATVIAKTDCSVGVLNGTEFMRLVTKYEPLTVYVLQRLAGIIRCADESIENLSLMGAEQRICLELLRYLEPDPGNLDQVRVYPVPTQVALADSLGVTRQTVARIFGKLCKEGTIERRGKSLFVLDCEKLEQFALHIKAT